jgi:hypothetical protein
MGNEVPGGPQYYGSTANTPSDLWAPPPAASRRARQRAPIAIAVVLLAAFAGGGAFMSVRSGNAGPAHPKQWDPRVANLASFVEHQRGLRFDHPVTVQFVRESAFKRRVTTDADTLSAEDRDDMENSVSFLRSIGLVEGDIDLLSVLNQASSEGVLAWYSPETEQIIVRGTELDVATRVTVVHEMTHALQDQHFDLTKLRTLDNDDDSGAITALVEGDAVDVENAYIEALSAKEHRAYDRQNAKVAAGADFDGVPPVVRIMLGAPYRFGPAFVQTVRADGGQPALDRAFERPPTAEEHVFNPVSYLDDDQPEPVAKPQLPRGAKETDAGNFEPLGWYIMLSERIDAHEALRVTDGWGGDSYVSYRTRDARSCTRIRYRGEDASDTARMRDALDEWIDALPMNTASVRDEGTTLLFESYDPGDQAHVTTDDSLDAIGLPVARVSIVEAMLHGDAPLDAAFCVANGVVEQATVAQLNDPTGAAFKSAEGERRVRDIAMACRSRTG